MRAQLSNSNRPGGPKYFSPRREPWETKLSPPSNQPRKGRKKSFPDVPLVVRDAVLFEEADEFFLKRNMAVVYLLLSNVFHHRSCIRLADAEGAVAGLPGETLATGFLAGPPRGIGFDDAHRFRDGHAGRQPKQHVNVVRHGV